MNSRKKYLIPILGATVVSLALLGGGMVYAQSDQPDGSRTTIIDRLVERFGLNKNDVQQVFDKERSDRQAEMQAKFVEQLDKLVSDGKITTEQKEAILAKKEEMQAAMQNNVGQRDPEEFKNLTQEERKAEAENRKAEMETQQKALEQWSKDNGIDVQYLRLLDGGFGPMGGHRGPNNGSDKPEFSPEKDS
jgi:hypothetical protein